MLIGIDAGTSVVKAVAFSDDGDVLTVESRQVKLYSPSPDRWEQDLEETLSAVGEVVRAVAGRAGGTPGVVGVTGQGDGLWLLDERGRSVRRGITWLDARSSPIVREWMASGVFEALYRRNGNVMFPGAPAPLLRALARQEPESLARAATAAYCKDAIVQRLTGSPARGRPTSRTPRSRSSTSGRAATTPSCSPYAASRTTRACSRHRTRSPALCAR